MAINNLLDEGAITAAHCDVLGLNAWAIKMVAESYIKSPVKIRYRGIRFLVNDQDIIIRPNLHMDELRDVRQLGNLSLEEIEYYEINPVAMVMIVKSFMQAEPWVRDNGVLFQTHDLYFQLKPETDSKLLLICKQDRGKIHK